MASEIKILRKFFRDIKNNSINEYYINEEFSYRIKFYKKDRDTIGPSYAALEIMNEGAYHSTILRFHTDNKKLCVAEYNHPKNYHIISISEFISNTDEELVLTYGRGILDDNILDVMKIFIPTIEISDLNLHLWN